MNNENAKQRLDEYLASAYPQYSRSYLAGLNQQGRVTVDGVHRKSSFRLDQNADVKLDLDERERLPELELPVLYENSQIVVINKPSGVLTHSKGAYNPEPTVASWLQAHVRREQSPDEASVTLSSRDGIVHRLDRATSGVLILAKDRETELYLQKQFSQKTVKKKYLALVSGLPKHQEAIIQAALQRNPKKPQTFRVHTNGKEALTKYRCLEHNKSSNTTLIELSPTTGRTHQLRVHLSYIGHPIVGDTLYGGKPANRLKLHAFVLEMTIPGGERKVFTVEAPEDF
jgi:23S rRNA pseudouridine1911/1915/1917 synthase